MKRTFLTLMFFILSFSTSLIAQPKTDYTALTHQFITAINSKDLEQIEQFVITEFAKDSLARWDGTGKDRYVGYSINQALFHGELKILSNELDTTNERVRTITKVQSINTDMQHEMVVFFNREDKRTITGFYINEDPKKSTNSAKLSDEEFIAEIKAYSDKLAKNGIFSGTILLAKGDKVLFSAAHGLASHRYDIENNLDTKFQIGSMNKMFTSVGILHLVEKGKMSLDDPLTKHIDRTLLGKGEFDKIKIKHMLSHTSGLGGITGFEASQSKIRSLKDTIPLFKSIDTTFEPGTQWRYSNTAMMLLGQIIENVSGEDYYDFIDKHIYKKAGMKHSGSFDLDVPIKNSARSYWFSVETGEITENLMFQSVKGGPAGGGYSTVGDLHKFALAMQNNTLLSKKLSHLALNAKPELKAPNWGYGFSVRAQEGNQVVGHNGSHLGMSARLNMYQDKGYILVVLGNYQSSAWPVIAKVDQLITRL